MPVVTVGDIRMSKEPCVNPKSRGVRTFTDPAFKKGRRLQLFLGRF